MSNETDNPDSKSYCYIGGKFALFILFILLLLVPFIITCSCNEEINNETNSQIIYELHSPKEASDTKNGDCENWKITQTKTSYNLPCIFLFVIYPLSLVALFIFFSKDDSCIRCAKLNALHSIKEKILACEFSDSIYEATEKNPEDCNKTVKTQTHNRADLLRHYMDCITEI